MRAQFCRFTYSIFHRTAVLYPDFCLLLPTATPPPQPAISAGVARFSQLTVSELRVRHINDIDVRTVLQQAVSIDDERLPGTGEGGNDGAFCRVDKLMCVVPCAASPSKLRG